MGTFETKATGVSMKPRKVTLHVIYQENPEDDGWVIVACPEIGVYTQGKTRMEAEMNLHEAVELWFECCIETGTLDEFLPKSLTEAQSSPAF